MAKDEPVPDQNGADESDSLHADIAAAMKEAGSVVESAGKGGQEADEPAPKATEAAEQPAGPARGADGKFVAKATAETEGEPKGATPGVTTAVQPPAATEQQPTATDRPPPGWSIEAKAAYAQLPPAIKAAIAKREQEVSDGFRQYSDRVKGFEGFDQVLAQQAPNGMTWAERLRAAGETPVAAIGRLLNAQAALERNPAGAIAWLAKEYGVDLRQVVGGATSGQQPAVGADGKPAPRHLQDLIAGVVQQAVQPYAQKIQTFEQGWQQRQQSEQQAEQAALTKQIEAFAADPKNLYFENVQSTMALLIKSGAADSLEAAYQMAIWSNPEIRQRLVSEQQAQALRTQQAHQQRVVSDARRTGGSITGAPEGGATPPINGAPPDDIRASVAQAWNAQLGRV